MLAVGFVLTVGLLAAGCGAMPEGSDDTFGVDFSPPACESQPSAIVFIVDGLNSAVFGEMLAAGELPAIQKYFVDRGAYAPRAVANVPSATLPNLTSLVSGRFVGHHDVVGIRVFDRSRCVYRQYDTIAQKNRVDDDSSGPQLYSQFPGAYTASLFCQPHKGATKFFENWLSAGPAFGMGWYEFVDRITMLRFGESMDLARRRNRWPALQVAYLLAPDFRAYESGAGSPEYRDAIRHADRQVGRVLGDLERAGRLDDTLIALVSDHSHSDISRHVDLADVLHATELVSLSTRRLAEGASFAARKKAYAQSDAVLCVFGDRFAGVSLRAPNSDWATALPGDDARKLALVDAIGTQPDIDTIAWKSGHGQVEIRNRTGQIRISRNGNRVRIERIRGKNPFGYHLPKTPVSRTSRQWLAETWATTYPDMPVQLLAYFDSPLAVDVAIFASPGADFGQTHRGGHGGLDARDDMLVPMLIAGPGVPHTQLGAVRTVDLAPTLLRLMGRPIPAGTDGKALFSRPLD